ncbi:MAG: DUF2341 domain-containing protein [Candidatus Omnitrophota bacterium]|nr:DUF2341 domain-containing protein [Candidatus Omnitrophota bacterium]
MINSIFSLEAIEKAEEDEMNKYTVGIILGLIGVGLYPALIRNCAGVPSWANCQAQATQVLEQAPIILEYNLSGPAAIETETITTSGTIKTISVSFESIGQVRLEASANGGIAYTKIINGQPLVDGFIPGNQLRLRANIGPDSVLKKLVIGYTDSSEVSKLYRNPDLANYKYDQEINISGGSQEVFNYPLRLNVDKDAIYFTAADGQTPLYYYLEGEIAASPAAPRNDESRVIANPPKAGEAICWVNVPQIPQEGTKIYMYYNDVITSSGGLNLRYSRNDNYNDGNKVFLFFDDFSGTALNEEKWEIIPGLKKEYNIQNGYLQLKDCLVVTRNFKTEEAILEFKAKAEENTGIQVVVRSKVNAQGLAAYEQIVYSSNYPGAEHTIAINNIAKVNIGKPIDPLTYYMYKATVNSTGILFERYSENQQEKQAVIKFLDVGNIDQGYIGLKSDAASFNAGSVYFDWIRVRPYVEVEPKVTDV